MVGFNWILWRNYGQNIVILLILNNLNFKLFCDVTALFVVVVDVHLIIIDSEKNFVKLK